MKMNKVIAGVMAVCVIGFGVPYINVVAGNNSVITATAFGTYEKLKYKNCGDYIEIIGGDRSAIVDIPAEIDGLPVRSIGKSAFFKWVVLSSITIPDSVTSIGDEAFLGCSGLTDITIPDSVTSIGDRAFYECTAFRRISIPGSVTSIGDEAFFKCTNLEEITIGDGVTSIGDFAFDLCSSLIRVTIPDSVTYIGKMAFGYTPWLKSKQYESRLVIVNGILIDGTTFKGDTVFIPNSVKSISKGAFEYCISIKEITIENPDCIIYDSAETISNGWDSNNVPYFNGRIYGYKNSTAQAYAEKYNYKFGNLGEAPEKEVSLGDINGDGFINSVDATAVLVEYAELSTTGSSNLTDEQKKVADINGDGIIDAVDATNIMQYYAYLSTDGKDSVETFIESMYK